MLRKTNIGAWYWLVVVFLVGIFMFPTKSWCSVENKTNDKSSYKIVKQKINLLPFKPLSILGINSVLIKDNKDETYLALISAKINKYKWHIDTLKINKKFLNNKEDNLNESVPLNVYLDETLDLLINIKKFNSVSYNDFSLTKADNINKVELPYFIVINDKDKDEIVILKQGTVAVNLNNKFIKIQENIKIMFDQKSLNNLELLVGFKQTPEMFDNLINYLKNYNKNLVESLDKNEHKL